MIVPDYWSEARRQHRAANRQITVRRFGWSNVSPEDAAAMAERRAEEALRRLVAGEKLARREPKVPYNGAEGVPIREEVVARHGDDVITRNAYGARCLNSPRALFADVDFDQPARPGPTLLAFALLLALAVVAGIARGSLAVGLGLAMSSMVLAPLSTALARRLFVLMHGGAQALARRRLGRFLDRHPDWNVRVYSTPNGLRLLATHRPFDPTDEEVATFFRAIRSDPLYVRMCKSQKCFRARLTAKPWRIGIATHLRPRPGVWPVAPEHMAARTAWIVEYEAHAERHAACRFLESLGSGVAHPRIRPVVALHDDACRAHQSGLPIA